MRATWIDIGKNGQRADPVDMELRREGRWSISSRGAAASPARAPRTISPRPRGYDHSPSRATLEARSKPSPKRRRRSASPRRRAASPRKKRSSRAGRSAQRRSPARSARRSGHEPGAAEAAEVPTVSAPRTPIGLPELVRLPPKQRRRNRSAGTDPADRWPLALTGSGHHPPLRSVGGGARPGARGAHPHREGRGRQQRPLALPLRGPAALNRRSVRAPARRPVPKNTVA